MSLRVVCFSVISYLFASIVAAVPQGTSKGEPGLLGTFTDGACTVVVVAPGPDFALKEKESIDPRLKPDFKATWTGSLNVIKQGKYAISLDGARDASQLSIDGNLVTEAILLDIGEHAIRVEYTRRPGAARQQLIWSSDDFLPEPIPQAALSHASTPPEVAAADGAERGRLLVESLNCVACHRTSSINVVGRRAPDLTLVGTRLRAAWIDRWLNDPHAYRGNAMMPRVPLKADDRTDITAYLSTLKNPDNKIKEQSARPSAHIAGGKQLFESIGCLACHTKMEGEQDAKKFSLHGIGSKWLTGQLAAYLENPLVVDHSGRMPSMLLTRDEARDLAEYLTELRDSQSATSRPASTPVDSVARGKRLVASEGCLQCHIIGGFPENPPAPKVAELEKLHDEKGCLAEKPTGKAMDYHLAREQRREIVAFIDSIRQSPLISASPASDFRHKVNTFGCTNCHELDAFKPAQETERIPMLTNVGARMRKEWINEVLTQRKRVRPWLHHRMPEFGSENVGNVAELAVGVSGAGEAETVPMPSRDETLAGQKLLGTGPGGLACITCHGFAGAKPSVADDTRGPDMTTVAARLRPDHFRRWVYDPKRVNPATPMPSFFEGVPAHEAVGKIETILHYCALGSGMPAPVGWIDEHNYVLVVRDVPLVNRAVMPNLNGGHNFPRGIGVGLPGLVSYCFDADTCMVKYAWSGGFLDMKGSWQVRGGNQVSVLGKKFWGSDRFPWMVGDSTEPPKGQFGGYSLVEGGAPQWTYRIGEAEVKETVTATENCFGIVRKFEIEPHGQAMTFVLVDKPEAAMQCSGAVMETAEVQLDPRKPEKVPAHAIKLTGTSKSAFTVTLSAKEEK